MNELVSIIMPSYNAEAYIEETIKSVINQTYTNWELLIVDDCSSDGTDEIISSFLYDKRIKYKKNEKNYGAAESRNRGLREAKGRWIAFLDSDDIWFPEKLKKQICFMETNHYSFSCTDYMINFKGKLLPYIYTSPNVITKRLLYRYCYFSTITVMYDQRVIGLIQIENIKKNNDYAMWVQIINKSNCYRLAECLSCYMKHDGSVSSGKKWRLIKNHYIMWHEACGKNKVVSLYLTINNLFFGVIKKIRYKVKIENKGEYKF